MRVAKVAVFAVASCAALAAAESFPSLGQPDTSNPAVAAFVGWHAALISGDFDAYRRLTPSVPNVNDGLLRQMFDHLRSTAPNSVNVTAPRTNANSSVTFESAGCLGSRPVVSVVTVGKEGGT